MNNRWRLHAPWYMTIASTLALIGLASYLVLNIEWFKSHAFESAHCSTDAAFRIQIHHIHFSMIKRSVAMFAGVAALLIGSAVSLHSLASETNIRGEVSGWSVQLATASPGIIAMVIGAILIGTTIASKDTFPQYSDRQSIIAPAQKTDGQSFHPQQGSTIHR